MRTLLALALFALALWRAVLDWMGSVALGEAWQFLTVGQMWGNLWPSGSGAFETLVTGFLGETVWKYASFILIMPVISVLCFLGAGLWMIRRPGGAERRRRLFR